MYHSQARSTGDSGFLDLVPNGEGAAQSDEFDYSRISQVEGAFLASGLSRFLAGGCIYQEGNHGGAGGFLQH